MNPAIFTETLDLVANHYDPERQRYEVSAEVWHQVREVMSSGVTFRELEQARVRARLQGRVDAGVTAVARRMMGIA